MQKPHIKYWTDGFWECRAEGLISLGYTPFQAYERWVIFYNAMERK
jgi:hypothetical protein